MPAMLPRGDSSLLRPPGCHRLARRHRCREDRAAAWSRRLLAGGDECAVDDVDNAAGARFGAHVGDRCRDGGLGTGPWLTPEHPEVPRRLVPFEDKAGMGAGAGTEARVAPEVLLG